MTRARWQWAFWLPVAAAISVACTSPLPCAVRDKRDGFSFCLNTVPVHPISREEIVFRVVVRDTKTGQPIEGGEGRVFGTSPDGTVDTGDGFAPTPELGAYVGKVHFVIAGDWNMALQFRRDSTTLPTRIDWKTNVLPYTGPGN